LLSPRLDLEENGNSCSEAGDAAGEAQKGKREAIKRLWKSSLVERELFVACLLVFGASISAIISAQDATHFALTSSLANSWRTISLDQSTFSGAPYTIELHGVTFSALPPGLAFFTFPLISIGQFLTPLAPSASGVYIATYFSCLFGALAAVIFYKTARIFSNGRISSFLTIVFAFGTNLWIYSRIYLPESLASCLTLASVYLILRTQITVDGETKHRKITGATTALTLFSSGILLGAGVFVDNVVIFFVIPIFLYLIFGIKFSDKSNRVIALISFVAGIASGLVPTWLYDILTTGNAFIAPYGVPFIGGVLPSSYSLSFLARGLYGILISPQSGLFLFTPFVFVSLIGFYYFAREKIGSAIFFFGLFLSVLLPMSLVEENAYFLHDIVGPSEIIIATPYLLIPAASVLKRIEKTISMSALICYVLGVSSIVITGIIALTDPIPGPTNLLSGAGTSSPLIATNMPLFIGQSFLTWWSFFSYPILYGILVLIFPILLLSYWMFAGTKMRKKIRTYSS
jgi:hypothetical protein